MPISWKGTLAQYAGRLHRVYQGKESVIIYDYVDEQVLTLLRMGEKRRKGYRALGYEEKQIAYSTVSVPCFYKYPTPNSTNLKISCNGMYL